MLCSVLALALLSLVLTASEEVLKTGNEISFTNYRKPKLFVRINTSDNPICKTDNAEYDQGSCLNIIECLMRRGSMTGLCSFGKGVCCILSTLSSTSVSLSYFTSKSGYKTYKVRRRNSSIKQLRLDFVEFSLAQPDDEGKCSELFKTSENTPVICGDNKNHHMYIPFNGKDEITLMVEGFSSGRWNIKVTQISEDSPDLAPEGCLQYYKEPSGTITSFNYKSGLSAIEQKEISNVDYFACIKSFGNCEATYTPNAGILHAIPIIRTDVDCPTDYVLIPNGVVTDGVGNAGYHFCGAESRVDRNPIKSKSLLLYVGVHTDDQESNETGGTKGAGFSFKYETICS